MHRRSRAALLLFSRSLSSAAEPPALGLAPGWQPKLLEAKKIVFIRHAEGFHNKDARELPNFFSDSLSQSMDYWDARLTPTGHEQCAKLQANWPEQAGAMELVAISPLTRTLQTASLVFPANATRPPAVATSLARERVSIHTCDGRRPRSELVAEFGDWVDFAEVTSEEDEMWPVKEVEVEFPTPDGKGTVKHSDACAARATELLRWLHARPESSIAVVSHWVFLLHMFRPFDHLFNAKRLQQRFGNAEARVTTLYRTDAGSAEKIEL